MLADKIIELRKKQGWSQEELADRVRVSRQAVSKWEGAQTVPDLDKILLLSELFGVSTDYLLKENINEQGAVAPTPIRRVEMTEAATYLEKQKRLAPLLALGTMLCILSPIALLLLLNFHAYWGVPGPGLAVAIGLAALLAIVAGAVAIFVYCELSCEPYAYLEREDFCLDNATREGVVFQRSLFRRRYVAFHVIGICLVILSPLPLLVSALLSLERWILPMLCVLLGMVGIGVALFVYAGSIQGSFKRLLREGEFSKKGKRRDRLEETVGGIYWMLCVAIYLAWSFATGEWGKTWILWPVAAVLFGTVSLTVEHIIGKKSDGDA